MSGPEMVTLGCRLNAADSAAIAALAPARGDLAVVNSCAVTAGAVRDTRAAIRKLAARRPDARILVTGCAAEIDPAGFAAMPEVSDVVRLADKFDPARYGAPATLPHAAADPATFAPVVADGRTRAFVGVQTGCDHSCTFCIIPQGRGPARSAAPEAVIDRIAGLVERGCREVVLTGVDLTSYAAAPAGGGDLGHLVEQILRDVPGLPRLRLSSLDSIEIDERLFDLITGEPRIMPHLHLSLQAGDDLILKRMKRRHRRADAVSLVARLKARRPDIAIGADLIAGFPTESEIAAANTRALLEDCDIVHAHIFPFSARAGTPAARMPQHAPELVAARAVALRQAADARRQPWLEAKIGTLADVLIERQGDRGHAPDFASVRLAGIEGSALAGRIVRTRITGRDGAGLSGVAA